MSMITGDKVVITDEKFKDDVRVSTKYTQELERAKEPITSYFVKAINQIAGGTGLLVMPEDFTLTAIFYYQEINKGATATSYLLELDGYSILYFEGNYDRQDVAIVSGSVPVKNFRIKKGQTFKLTDGGDGVNSKSYVTLYGFR